MNSAAECRLNTKQSTANCLHQAHFASLVRITPRLSANRNLSSTVARRLSCCWGDRLGTRPLSKAAGMPIEPMPSGGPSLYSLLVAGNTLFDQAARPEPVQQQPGPLTDRGIVERKSQAVRAFFEDVHFGGHSRLT